MQKIQKIATCLVILMSFVAIEAQAQEKIEKKASDRWDVNFTTVQVEPSYEGGEAALALFIHNNVVLPDSTTGVNEEMMISMDIDVEGKPVDITFLTKSAPEIENAVKNVLETTVWNPATVNGIKIRKQYFLTFTLTK